jgi:hypothetical protein
MCVRETGGIVGSGEWGKRVRASHAQSNYMLFMLLKENGCQYSAWKETLVCY